MSRKPNVTAVVERNSRIERRLSGNPLLGTALAIPSKQKDDKGRSLLVFRIADADIGVDHIWRTKEKGWDFAEPGDIDGRPEDYGGFDVRDNRLVRGPKGSQVLMKMRRSDYDAIQVAKTAHNRTLVGAKSLKEGIVSAASAELGDEGANFLHRSLGNVQVADTYEKVPKDEF